MTPSHDAKTMGTGITMEDSVDNQNSGQKRSK